MIGSTGQESFLHSLNPLLKLAALVAVTIGVLIYPSWRMSTLLLVCVLAGFLVSRTHPRLSARRAKFFVLFAFLLVLLQVVVTPNGTVLFHLMPGPSVPVTTFGLERGLSMAVRFLVIVFASMLFVAITDPTLLAHSLRMIGVQYRYAFMLVIALRFLPLFDLENQIVRMAQRSRGISVEVGGIAKTLRTVRYTFFPLLVSALSRVDSLSISMDGRGFGYAKHRTYLRESQWNVRDSSVLALVAAYLLLTILLASGQAPQIAAFL